MNFIRYDDGNGAINIDRIDSMYYDEKEKLTYIHIDKRRILIDRDINDILEEIQSLTKDNNEEILNFEKYKKAINEINEFLNDDSYTCRDVTDDIITNILKNNDLYKDLKNNDTFKILHVYGKDDSVELHITTIKNIIQYSVKRIGENEFKFSFFVDSNTNLNNSNMIINILVNYFNQYKISITKEELLNYEKEIDRLLIQI